MCAQVAAQPRQIFGNYERGYLDTVYPGQPNGFHFEIADNEMVKIVGFKLHDRTMPGESTVSVKHRNPVAEYTIELGTISQSNPGPIIVEYVYCRGEQVIVSGEVPVDVVYGVETFPDEEEEEEEDDDEEEEEEEERESDPEFSDDDDGVVLHF